MFAQLPVDHQRYRYLAGPVLLRTPAQSVWPGKAWWSIPPCSPRRYAGIIRLGFAADRSSNNHRLHWGRFDVRLNSRAWIYRVIESLMNMRSAWTGVVTGDQALFIKRNIFQQLQGYADIPLMEDIELSKRLRKHTKPIRIKIPVLASTRRWRRDGIIRTILLMWVMRFAYWLGVSPTHLARWYR